MEKRDFSLGKRDLLILLAVAVLALAGWFFWRGSLDPAGQNLAVIALDGVEIRRIDLQKEPDGRFSLQEQYSVPVSFEVKDGAIRFVDVDCPDHICENTGWVSLEGQTAVCMPNRTALSVYGQQG